MAAGSTDNAKPRGGILPWLLFVTAAALFGYGHLTRVAPAGMVDTLMREFAVGAAALGNLSAMYWYAYAAFQIPGGFLLDRFGPARVMALSALLATGGGVLFAYAPGVELANLGRFITGAGCATLYGGCLKFAGQWFAPRHFSLLGGLTVLIGMIGAASGQAPVAALVELGGWRPVALGVALIALPLGALLWLRRAARPPAVAPVVPFRALGVMLRQAAASRQVWLATLFTIMACAPVISFTLWGVAYYMQVHGHTRPAAALFTSTALLGWALGSLLFGWGSGRIGRRRLPAAASAALALVGWSVFVALPQLPDAAHFVLMFGLGFASGGVVVGFALVAEHGPPRAVGLSTGLANTFVMLFSAVVQLAMGGLLDLQWLGETTAGVRLYPPEAYRVAFAVMPAISLLALVAALLVRETHCRPQSAPP